MYKIAKILPILCLLGLMASCNINDSYTDCACDVTLKFEYYGDTTANVIDKYITKGSLYIYDSSGKLIGSPEVSKDELQNGKTLHLKFGNYKFICWGNQTAKSKVIDANLLESARIAAPEFFDKKKIQTNDKLYYTSGDLDLTAPSLSNSTQSISKTLTFKNSHINFIVRTYGYKNNKNLQLELTNLMPEYNFNMGDAAPFSTTYYPSESSMEKDQKGTTYQQFKFTSLRFNNKNNIVVKLFDGDNKTSHAKEIKLEDFLDRRKINVEMKQEITLLITFRYIFDGNVKVDIIEWDSQEIIPING